MNEKEVMLKINKPIIHNYSGRYEYAELSVDKFLGEKNGKEMWLCYPRNVAHADVSFGIPQPDENELKRPIEVIFRKEEINKNVYFEKGRPVWILSPTKYDIQNKDSLKNKPPLLCLIDEQKTNIETLKRIIGNQTEEINNLQQRFVLLANNQMEHSEIEKTLELFRKFEEFRKPQFNQSKDSIDNF